MLGCTWGVDEFEKFVTLVRDICCDSSHCSPPERVTVSSMKHIVIVFSKFKDFCLLYRLLIQVNSSVLYSYHYP